MPPTCGTLAGNCDSVLPRVPQGRHINRAHVRSSIYSAVLKNKKGPAWVGAPDLEAYSTYFFCLNENGKS